MKISLSSFLLARCLSLVFVPLVKNKHVQYSLNILYHIFRILPYLLPPFSLLFLSLLIYENY